MNNTVSDGHDSFDDALVRAALERLGPAPAPPPLSMVMRRARRDSRRRRGVWALSGATAAVAVGAGAVALLRRDDNGTSTITVTEPQRDARDEVAVTTTLPPTTAPSTTAPPDTDAPAGATRRHAFDPWGLSVELPAAWEGRSAGRYAGEDGYLTVSALSAGQTLQTKARQQAEHKLRPFGSAPTITETTVAGQPAMVIEPSPDAPRDHGHLPAAVIVELPDVVVWRRGVWQFASLYVDTGHLDLVLATFRFE